MRRVDEIRLLQKASQIRALQLSIAERKVLESASVMQECQEHLAECAQRRNAMQQGWESYMATPSVGLDLARLWTSAVLREDAAVHRADAGLAQARSVHMQDSSKAFAAKTRKDAALDLLRRARRKHVARKDEADMSDASDLFLTRQARR